MLEGIAICDRDGRIVYANDGNDRIVGRTAQKVRRACYVLRKETTSLLDTLDGAE